MTYVLYSRDPETNYRQRLGVYPSAEDAHEAAGDFGERFPGVYDVEPSRYRDEDEYVVMVTFKRQSLTADLKAAAEAYPEMNRDDALKEKFRELLNDRGLTMLEVDEIFVPTEASRNAGPPKFSAGDLE